MHCLDILWVENFNEIALSHTVEEIEANLCFAILAKIRKFKMAAILGRGNFLKIAKSTFLRYPVGHKISTKSLYLVRLRRKKQICVLPFLAKMAANFGRGNFF